MRELLFSISQRKINNFYKKTYNLIDNAKQSIQNGKPLLILVGEDHYSSRSRFIELVFYSCAKYLGLSKVGLEWPQKKLEIEKNFSDLQFNLTSSVMTYLLKRSSLDGINVFPLEAYWKHEAFSSITNSHWQETKFHSFWKKNLEKLSMSVRDRHMASELIKNKNNNDLVMAVCGAAHLEEILKQKPLLKDSFNILIIEAPALKTYWNSFGAFPADIPLKYQVFSYSNDALYDKIIKAKIKNLDNSVSEEKLVSDDITLKQEKSEN